MSTLQMLFIKSMDTCLPYQSGIWLFIVVIRVSTEATKESSPKLPTSVLIINIRSREIEKGRKFIVADDSDIVYSKLFIKYF